MAEESKDKIDIERVSKVLGALRIIPRASLCQKTRLKILRWIMAYDELLEDYNKKIASAREKVKPEGFDERMAPYWAALYPTKENAAEAEEQAAAEGFAEAKAEWDNVNADLQAMVNDLAKSTKWDAPEGLPVFTDEDFEEIGSAIPSGGPSVMQQAQEQTPTADGETPTEDPETGTPTDAAAPVVAVPNFSNDDLLMIIMYTLR